MVAIVINNFIIYGPSEYERALIFRALIPYGATMTADIVSPVDLPADEPGMAMDLGLARLLPVVVLPDAPGEGQIVAGHETVVLADRVEVRPAYGATPIVVPSTTMTKYAFSKRFTADEMIGILAAQSSDAAVALFLKLLDYAQDVDLTDVNIQSAFGHLVDRGLLTQDRATAILTP